MTPGFLATAALGVIVILIMVGIAASSTVGRKAQRAAEMLGAIFLIGLVTSCHLGWWGQ